MKEVDVARPVVQWLKDKKLEVYQEVQLQTGMFIVDILARDSQTWIVETKTSLSWDLLAQATRRRNYAHKVSLAVPFRKWKQQTRRYVHQMLEREGLGLISVHKNGMVFEEVRPPINEHPRDVYRWDKILSERHKDYIEAGTPGGGHWTPFKGTCEQVLKAVTQKQGLSPTQLVNRISHHYASDSSAKGSLTKWGRLGKIPGVKVVEKNGPKFFLE